MKRCMTLDKAPRELRPGIKVLMDYLPIGDAGDDDTVLVRFSPEEEGVSIKPDKEEDPESIEIRYGEISDAFRGLGIISGRLKAEKGFSELHEKNHFKRRWLMLDVSRNGAAKAESVKELLCRMALMGINGFMLYTETNYEVAGEPYWGYHDGKYSASELSKLDSIAGDLGIEMIPCIQTLAHLTRALQWGAYKDVKDTESVLMVGEKETYRLIKKIIQAAVKPYKSKRIHIGMDEAWDLGLGNHLEKNGYTAKGELIRKHLAQVIKITDSLKLRPMMWSDMFFRAASPEGVYRDKNISFTDEDRRGVPESVELVYWDYYNHEEELYDSIMKKHEELTDPDRVVFATGTQTWSRFWPCFPSAFSTINAGISAAVKHKMEDVIITSWGDDGNEYDPFSALPVLQFFSECTWGYGAEKDFPNPLNLLGSSGIEFDVWKSSGRLDSPPGIRLDKNTGNISKALLWEDPLWGTVQALLPEEDLGSHWRGIARSLENMFLEGGINGKLEIPYRLSLVLAAKWDLPSRIREAYKKGKKDVLSRIAEVDIPQLQKKVRKLWEVHRRTWFETFKPSGWEILENRYGGLLLRLETVRKRLLDYFNRQLESLPELEEPELPIANKPEGNFPNLRYRQVYGPTKVPVQ
jgi:hexosaminidase